MFFCDATIGVLSIPLVFPIQLECDALLDAHVCKHMRAHPFLCILFVCAQDCAHVCVQVHLHKCDIILCTLIRVYMSWCSCAFLCARTCEKEGGLCDRTPTSC